MWDWTFCVRRGERVGEVGDFEALGGLGASGALGVKHAHLMKRCCGCIYKPLSVDVL